MKHKILIGAALVALMPTQTAAHPALKAVTFFGEPALGFIGLDIATNSLTGGKHGLTVSEDDGFTMAKGDAAATQRCAMWDAWFSFYDVLFFNPFGASHEVFRSLETDEAILGHCERWFLHGSGTLDELRAVARSGGDIKAAYCEADRAQPLRNFDHICYGAPAHKVPRSPFVDRKYND